MEKIIIYGIPNCDTIKKTVNWFNKQKIDFEFHDYKKSGIAKGKLADWCKQVSWEVLLNKRSTTWRSLSLPEQEKIIDQSSAIKLMMANNSIIKRPVIENGKELIVGFIETEITKQLKIKK